ncbi:hypothetical protein BACUNI_02445 [Bacteroides uniformis ATCC 8492]|uniref:Transposase n=1 Tax=Bacteroides uniformis (strain ATCC 8492 / DSM 6597 / CCUG 4942 / CIP 103695 / JCM 5828 / KCTC 5204 / NCTC 13054 / VPI 0061) TaxID=411479 RepID=A0ABC9NAX8_BACUC|nr:hypothetical protein BACUNI_02445 [Bacteroides uniformis ATCC 8492]
MERRWKCGSNLHKHYLRKHFFLSLMGIKKNEDKRPLNLLSSL